MSSGVPIIFKPFFAGRMNVSRIGSRAHWVPSYTLLSRRQPFSTRQQFLSSADHSSEGSRIQYRGDDDVVDEDRSNSWRFEHVPLFGPCRKALKTRVEQSHQPQQPGDPLAEKQNTLARSKREHDAYWRSVFHEVREEIARKRLVPGSKSQSEPLQGDGSTRSPSSSPSLPITAPAWTFQCPSDSIFDPPSAQVGLIFMHEREAEHCPCWFGLEIPDLILRPDSMLPPPSDTPKGQVWYHHRNDTPSQAEMLANNHQYLTFDRLLRGICEALHGREDEDEHLPPVIGSPTDKLVLKDLVWMTSSPDDAMFDGNIYIYLRGCTRWGVYDAVRDTFDDDD